MKKVARKNMEEFEKIKENEWFEYYTDFYPDEKPMLGVKIDNNYVAFINCNFKFIIGKVYKNCISIGSGYIYEFYTFHELMYALMHRIDQITKISNL